MQVAGVGVVCHKTAPSLASILDQTLCVHGWGWVCVSERERGEVGEYVCECVGYVCVYMCVCMCVCVCVGVCGCVSAPCMMCMCVYVSRSVVFACMGGWVWIYLCVCVCVLARDGIFMVSHHLAGSGS